MTTKTGKCQHEHLVVGSSDGGVWFHATCKECGMEGLPAASPHEARVKFNRRLGARNSREEEDD